MKGKIGKIGIILGISLLMMIGCTNQKTATSKNKNEVKIIKTVKQEPKIKTRWVQGVPKEIAGVYKCHTHMGPDPVMDYLDLNNHSAAWGIGDRVVIENPATYQLAENIYLIKGTENRYSSPGITFYIKVFLDKSGKNKRIGMYENPSADNPTFEGMKKSQKLAIWYQATNLKSGEEYNSKDQLKEDSNPIYGRIFRRAKGGDKSRVFLVFSGDPRVQSREVYEENRVLANGKDQLIKVIENPDYLTKTTSQGQTVTVDGSSDPNNDSKPVTFKILSDTQIQKVNTGEIYTRYDGSIPDLIKHLGPINKNDN